MQLAPKGPGQFELKSRDLTVRLNDRVTINDFTVPGPGEYEIGGLMVPQSDLITRIEVEDLVLGLLAPGVTGLTDREFEQIGAIDVLFFHIGDGTDLSPKHVHTLLAQVEAPLVIPIPAGETDVMAYCTKDMRCETVTSPFKLTRSQLPIDGSQVIVFN